MKKDYHSLTEELKKIPFFNSVPIFFSHPRMKKPSNGTLTLLEIDSEIIGVTCWHVIKEYQTSLSTNKDSVFQIGNNILDPTKLIIDKNNTLDLVTLRLSKKMLAGFRSQTCPEIGSQRISLNNIYQSDIQPNDIILLGGFPGKWVEIKGIRRVQYETLTLGGKVESSHHNDFAIQMDNLNDLMIPSNKKRPKKEMKDPGGLSGGPAFILRELESGIIYYQPAGIIYEGKFFDKTLIAKVRPLKLISSDGSIKHDFSDHLLDRRSATNDLNLEDYH